MNNEDFRKLVATPAVFSGASRASAIQSTSSKSSLKDESSKESQEALAKKRKREFFRNQARQKARKGEANESNIEYRDRAAERRKGLVDDSYKDAEAMAKDLMATQALGSDGKQLGSFITGQSDTLENSSQPTPMDTDQLQEQHSKYLGGHVTRTHLVKGLDVALLAKAKAAIASTGSTATLMMAPPKSKDSDSNSNSNDTPDISSKTSSKDKDQNPSLRTSDSLPPLPPIFKTRHPDVAPASTPLGASILVAAAAAMTSLSSSSSSASSSSNSLHSSSTSSISESFLPKRTTYIFSVNSSSPSPSSLLGSVISGTEALKLKVPPSTNIHPPTTRKRAKADCPPPPELVLVGQLLGPAGAKLRTAMAYVAASKRSKRNKSSSASKGPEKALGESSKIITTNIRPDDDDDIFDDAPEYVAAADLDNAQDLAAKVKSTVPANLFKAPPAFSQTPQPSSTTSAPDLAPVKPNFSQSAMAMAQSVLGEEGAAKAVKSALTDKQKAMLRDMAAPGLDSRARKVNILLEGEPGDSGDEDNLIDTDMFKGMDESELDTGPVDDYATITAANARFESDEEDDDEPDDKEGEPDGEGEEGEEQSLKRKRTRRELYQAKVEKDEAAKEEREWNRVSSLMEAKAKGGGLTKAREALGSASVLDEDERDAKRAKVTESFIG